mgnify:CR=1 FL=1|jgi:hypothetical protein
MEPSKYDKRLTHGEDYYKKIGKLGGMIIEGMYRGES